MYPFAGFGYEAYWYGSLWYSGARYHWGPHFAQHRRYHRMQREMIASATADEQQATQSVAPHEPDQSEPRLAMASADPAHMMNLGIGPSNSQHVASPAVRTRLPNGFPAINVIPSCRAGAAVGLDQGIDTCLAAEMDARDRIAQDWNQFLPADRSSCVRVATVGGGGSYAAVLSCLEMKRDARNLSKL
jgi:hypothetical protein